MENDPQTRQEEEIHEQNEEIDPIITEEAEQFLQQALEVSNRYGVSLPINDPEPKKDSKEETEKGKNDKNEIEKPKIELKEETEKGKNKEEIEKGKSDKNEIEKPKNDTEKYQDTQNWVTSFQKEAKKELQQRLRKRIEEKEALAAQKINEEGIKSQQSCEEHKKKE